MAALRVATAALSICGALAACTNDEGLLLVDLRTDLLPGQEFELVSVSLGDAPSMAVPATTDMQFITGERVAEIAVDHGSSATLDVSLVKDGDVVLTRSIRVDVAGQTGVTVVMTRDCRGVTCDSPAALACLGGRCVSERCTEETPAECGDVPDCAVDADCDGSLSCVTPTCAAGACLRGTDAASCTSAEICDPDVGCAARERGPVPRVEWSLAANGSGNEHALGVATDDALNVYATGAIGTADEFDLGGGPEQLDVGTVVFVASYDVAGAYRWSTLFGQGGRSQNGRTHMSGMDVALDGTGNVYVAGSVLEETDFGGGATPGGPESNAFVASWDGDGVYRWAQRATDTGASRAHGVAIDPAGSVVITGYFWDETNLGSGELASAGISDVFLASYDAMTGAPLLSTRFGGDGEDRGHGVAVDPGSNVSVGGRFRDQAVFGSAMLPERPEIGGFVAHTDGSATTVWANSVSVPEDRAEVQDLRMDAMGNVYATGWYEGGLSVGAVGTANARDGFVMSFDPTGAPRWAVSQFGPRRDEPKGLAVTAAGDVYVTGLFTQSVDLGGGGLYALDSDVDIFVGRYTSEGVHVWSVALGGEENDEANGITVDASGGVVIVGRFQGAGVDFGAGPTGDSTSHQTLILRMAPPAAP